MKSRLGMLTEKLAIFVVLFTLFLQVSSFAQNANWINLDTVKAGRFDTGRMWTFEYPPLDYFNQAYNFKPDETWFEHVRMSALRFANYCSASFVSADGLVMTNHHCARQSITQVNKEGEDLHANGFIAETLQDERPVPGLYVDQLVLFKDVTDEVIDAMNEGKTDEERSKIESEIIDKIEQREAAATGLTVSVTPLYNGGRYSLYGYKRYSDVRLVLAAEDQLGFFGGDPDNFTYPRFNLDCSFFRVYDESGKPLKTDNYFKWSANGPAVDEPVFVVGNPGSTNRLNTVSQLEYARDIQYPRTVGMLSTLTNMYKDMLKKDPSRKAELEDRIFGFENSLKVINGTLKGLRDPELMQRKRDFEKNFRNSVNADPELKQKYGDLWDKISDIRKQLTDISVKNFALSMNRFTTPQYFFIADQIIEIANELKKPEAERNELYVGDELNHTLESLIPEDFDYEMNNALLLKRVEALEEAFGSDDPIVKKFTGGKKGQDAVQYILSHSKITKLDDIKTLLSKGADEVLNSDDPFIYLLLNTKEKADGYTAKSKELTEIESSYSQKLGEAAFAVYGTSIPPDATFTLRIADGVVKGYPYNGTIAQPFTTYYGLYDRFYGQEGKFPWNLPDRWLTPPADFNLSTPLNFVSTNDIVGGNSGSPVINQKAEIVGLAFDGNIESLPSNFIYTTEQNRSVSVHSSGMMEAIDKIYKLNRVSAELKAGRIVN